MRVLEALCQVPGMKTKYISYITIVCALLDSQLLSGSTVDVLVIRVLHWSKRIFETGVCRFCLFVYLHYFLLCALLKTTAFSHCGLQLLLIETFQNHISCQ